MKSFAYVRAAEPAQAVAACTPGAKFLGGGTNLLDLMKVGVEAPVRLVDINRLPLAQIEELPEGRGLRLGALARNSDVAAHRLVATRYPVLSEALLSGASPQLRNMATVGGNLLQRTRCPYFYHTDFPACNKRNPGSGCGALTGWNRMHAILGQSEHCIATHPSDMCVALVALDAVIRVQGPRGEREIAVGDFHRLPGDTPERDTNLEADELIVAVDLPATPWAAHSRYVKIRDRESYAFALVSVAAALELEGGAVKTARIVLGGVAHKPWRAKEAEDRLIGRPVDELSLREATNAALVRAQGYRDNTFKIELARRTLLRTLRELAGSPA